MYCSTEDRSAYRECGLYRLMRVMHGNPFGGVRLGYRMVS